MPKKIAWLLEYGDELVEDDYRTVLSDFNLDFFRTSSEILEKLDSGYDLFILGLFCPREPYTYKETDNGHTVGLRLIDDIRANPATRDTPVLISSTTTWRCVNEIKEKTDYMLQKVFTMDELRDMVYSLLGE